MAIEFPSVTNLSDGATTVINDVLYTLHKTSDTVFYWSASQADNPDQRYVLDAGDNMTGPLGGVTTFQSSNLTDGVTTRTMTEVLTGAIGDAQILKGNYNSADGGSWDSGGEGLTIEQLGEQVRFSFTTPRETVDYTPMAQLIAASPNYASVTITDITTTGFTVYATVSSGSQTKAEFAILVVLKAGATTLFATGPGTVSYNGVQGGINSDGTKNWGVGFSSVRNFIGNYTVTWDTALPSADYVVTLTPGDQYGGGASQARILNQTANGIEYELYLYDSNQISKDGSVLIALLPSSLQTKTRGCAAYGVVAADFTIEESFNIDTVTSSGNATYTVTFATPMPDANYAIVFGGINSSVAVTATAYSDDTGNPGLHKTAAGFTYYTTADTNGALSPSRMCFAIFAEV